MPYKISGDANFTVRVVVINQSDWSIESNTVESASSYELFVTNSAKTIVARKSDGESIGYGNITPEWVVGDRGVFGGGGITAGAYVNVIDYITVSTTGNANNFGDLTVIRSDFSASSNGTNDRGVFGGGTNSSSQQNIVDYIAISTLGDAAFFGNLTLARYTAGASNGINDRAVFMGGWNVSNYSNIIDYITISTTGNANNFGDLTGEKHSSTGLSNGTNNRGINAGGRTAASTYINVIEYITISSAGDATDFGDLSDLIRKPGATSNGTNNRGVIAGGRNSGSTALNNIDYITISSTPPSNATDFGDLTIATQGPAGLSNGTSNRGVFGGGWDGTNFFDTIGYIAINSASNANDFGDLTVARHTLAATSNA